MRPWLYKMLVTGKVPFPGICFRCQGEVHGQCLLAWKTYLHPCKCRCRRRECGEMVLSQRYWIRAVRRSGFKVQRVKRGWIISFKNH